MAGACWKTLPRCCWPGLSDGGVSHSGCLGSEDGCDPDNAHAGPWRHAIDQGLLCRHDDVSWHLASGHVLGRLLQLERLRVGVCREVGHDNEGVQRAGLVAGGSIAVASVSTTARGASWGEGGEGAAVRSAGVRARAEAALLMRAVALPQATHSALQRLGMLKPPNAGETGAKMREPQLRQRSATRVALGAVRLALTTMPGTTTSLFMCAAVMDRMRVGAMSDTSESWKSGAASDEAAAAEAASGSASSPVAGKPSPISSLSVSLIELSNCAGKQAGWQKRGDTSDANRVVHPRAAGSEPKGGGQAASAIAASRASVGDCSQLGCSRSGRRGSGRAAALSTTTGGACPLAAMAPLGGTAG